MDLQLRNCITCLVDKVLSEFYYKKSSNTYEKRCKLCRKKERQEKYRAPGGKLRFARNVSKSYQKLEDAVYEAYGNKCIACANNIRDNLLIDKNDNVAPYRPQEKKRFLAFLRKNHYPNNYIILCLDCRNKKITCKKCSKCEIVLELDNFHYSTFLPANRSNICKSCDINRRSKDKSKNNIASRKSEQKTRLAAFNAYGGPICICCGEKEEIFLTIDHLYNDGNKHRREDILAKRTYRWLKRNNYPPGFQVLCMNCNWGKHRNKGICPHKIHEVANV